MRPTLSDTLHTAAVEVRGLPATKRFQRFFPLSAESFSDQLDIERVVLEITIVETPRHDWGIRGEPGDELSLSYRVET